MDRRDEIENIIIGTLLNSTADDNYFDNCKSCITPDMFTDDRKSRIFVLVKELNGKGVYDTNPLTLFSTFGQKIYDIIPFAVELSTDWCFFMMKYKYNRKIYYSFSERKLFTNVSFDNYVSQFIKIAYENK